MGLVEVCVSRPGHSRLKKKRKKKVTKVANCFEVVEKPLGSNGMVSS